MKKAQGMSLKVIIVAVVALIVLVVLILIFTGKSKMFTKGTSDTASQYEGSKCKIPGTGRECAYDEQECLDKGGVYDMKDGGYPDCYNAGCCQI
ncbi:hypothetical protein ACFL0V_04770 [Nanoarchaeota archaeon]